ncbi:MAG: FAD-dependent oxidoreductase, partial [Cryobacterium sp.]
MRRRTFLIGSAGMSVVALAACTTPQPTPVPSVTPTLAPTVVPRPRAMRRSAWSKDPFARGSFSFSAVGSTPQDRTTLATPVGDRVFFAGEATSADMPGTVAGARASGGRAAAEVMAVAAPGERITIIGAGIADITAARLVKDAGFDVVVIEARGRVGGRISTVTDSTWPFPIELGPAFIDGSAESPSVPAPNRSSRSVATAYCSQSWSERPVSPGVFDRSAAPDPARASVTETSCGAFSAQARAVARASSPVRGSSTTSPDGARISV